MSPKKEPSAERSLDGELVQVFDSQSETEALVVKGLLESAGIDAAVISLDAPPDVLPGVGGIVVRVAADRADEARQVIADSREIGPDSTDSDVNDGPAA